VKTCGHCKIEKPESDFAPSEFNKSGGSCSVCLQERVRAYREAHPEKEVLWYKTDKFCDICNYAVRRHHLARHMKSKGHIARAGRPYEMLESDKAFSRFLIPLSRHSFFGYELKLFDQHKLVGPQ